MGTMEQNLVVLLGAKSQAVPLEAIPKELSQLKTLFMQYKPQGYEVDYEPYLTLTELNTILRRTVNRIDVLHYAGHSSPTTLTLNDGEVYMRHVAAIFKTWRYPPRLVFLNGCENKAQVTDLLAAGVGLVIATYKPINDDLAVEFAQEFYKNLLNVHSQTSYQQAFDRASSAVFASRAGQARSLDLDVLASDPQQAGDWGLFSAQPDVKQQFFTPVKSVTPITGTHTMRYQQLQEREQNLYKKLSILETERDMETREEERMRQDYRIRQVKADLESIQQQMRVLRGES